MLRQTHKKALRLYSTVVEVSQRELREKAIAEALARDEEALQRAKRLRELKHAARTQISTLNKTPATLANERAAHIQAQLDQLPQEKVKTLNAELEDFFTSHMHLPVGEVVTRPWFRPTPTIGGNAAESTQKIKSTTASFTNDFPNLKVTPDYKPYSEQELFLRHLAHSRHSGALGLDVTDVYRPRNDTRHPADVSQTTVATLLAAGCHLGHAKASWRPSTQPFIYGEYDGVYLIDLNETLVALKRAARVIEGVSKKGGIILYVGTHKSPEHHLALEHAALRSSGYYISKRWIPGLVTNFTEVTKQIGGASRIEVDMTNASTGREVGERNLIKPDLVVLLNPVDNRNCINECIKGRVPTIGLCDTDMEPSLLTYPIPCNDDSVRATLLVLGVLSKAAERGLGERLEVMREYQAAQRARLANFVKAAKGV